MRYPYTLSWANWTDWIHWTYRTYRRNSSNNRICFQSKPLARLYLNTANTPIIVPFPVVAFDFNSEYDGTSTFTPKQDGVYQINSNVLFAPSNPLFYIIETNLLVNNVVVAHDVNEYSLTSRNSTSLSTIYGLKAGDTVTIQFICDQDGSISLLSSSPVTSFSAARFPFTSPIP
jgi:hypothetical protein